VYIRGIENKIDIYLKCGESKKEKF